MPHSAGFTAISADEIREKYRQIAHFTPTLGIIFSSVSLGIDDVAAAIGTGSIPVFGCSTAGEILVTGEGDPIYNQSAVCCFLDIDPALFRVSLFGRGNVSPFELGQQIGRWGTGQFSCPAFIIVIGGQKNDGEAIVRGIQQAAGQTTPIFGGVAGDDGLQVDTMVFTQEGVSHDGAAVLIFDTEKVDVAGITSSGWTGIGADMTITSSSGNIVSTINGRPAIDVMGEYLDAKPDELLPIVINFPLQVRRPDGTEVLRAALAMDAEKGALIFAGTVPEGSLVRFSSSFGYQTIEEAVRDMEAFHARHPHASLLLLFSCLARYRVAGAMAADEVLAASRLWHAPLAGFFSYGEIGPNNRGACDFFNETLSLVLISLRR